MSQTEINDSQQVNASQGAVIGQMANDVLQTSTIQSMVAGEATMKRTPASLKSSDKTMEAGHPYLKQILDLHHAYSPVYHPHSPADYAPATPSSPASTPPVPTPVPQVTILGPFNTNYIAFDNGVPVGGSASLTLHSDGTYSFNGSFHDSGAPSYNVEFSWVIVGAAGTAYSFTASGHMAGTFESGSRDCIWTQSNRNDDIALHWDELTSGYTWRWQAYVNWNVQSAVDSLVSALKAAGTVIATVVAVVAVVA
ncbi:hypothetical protein KDA_43520 [Dictyobacter alpinus]|uniref:Uncharacterized protein n=2 Tax=Dictyobacter alpinus TaxID=2014873 RepID=A0A402BBS0_9CHLR|nr:hypothetical protein KDA_43520 [Dictyobacter alpinus]